MEVLYIYKTLDIFNLYIYYNIPVYSMIDLKKNNLVFRCSTKQKLHITKMEDMSFRQLQH